MIAGFAGSALVNLLYCDAGKRVIVVGPSSYTSSNDYMIGSILGMRSTRSCLRRMYSSHLADGLEKPFCRDGASTLSERVGYSTWSWTTSTTRTPTSWPPRTPSFAKPGPRLAPAGRPESTGCFTAVDWNEPRSRSSNRSSGRGLGLG